MIIWRNIQDFFPLTLGGNDYLAKYSWIYSHDSKIETVFPLVWCGTDSGVTHQWIINWIQLRSIELDSNCNSLFVKKDLPFPPTPCWGVRTRLTIFIFEKRQIVIIYSTKSQEEEKRSRREKKMIQTTRYKYLY